MAYYKATKDFQTLGIENGYQRLSCDDFWSLVNGETVQLIDAPQHLIDGDYIVKVTKQKKEGQ